MRYRPVSSSRCGKTIGLAKHIEYSKYENIRREQEYGAIKERFYKKPYCVAGGSCAKN